MTTKISKLTVVNLQGTREYCIGLTYNGLLLATINDNSIEYEDSLVTRFEGVTHCGERVFDVINAPVDIEYSPIEN